MKRFRSPLSAIAAAGAVAAALGTVPLDAQALAAERTRVLVQYKAGAGADVRALVVRLGGKVEVDLDEVGAVAVTLPRSALVLLRAARNITAVDSDPERRIMGGRLGPRSGSVATATAGTQVVPYGIQMVQADLLPGGAAWTPKICIVDSGIDGTHEDLAGNPLDGRNYTAAGTWDTDKNDHGTHVAGTVAALNNAVGVVGVAPSKELSLYIAKVFDASGSAPASVIAEGMLGCAAAGANVVSMSLGGGRTPIEQIVVRLLARRNMLLIAAAGNAGTGATSYPAGFAEVMSVAAVDAAKAWASFSQFDLDVEIAAPGVAVESTVPMGGGSETRTTVDGTPYQSAPLTGSPITTAIAPLYYFGLGTATDLVASGKVCLIQRGSVSFADKVLNCQRSGGVGAVIHNTQPVLLFGTLGSTVTTIPSMGVSSTDGAATLTEIGQSAKVDNVTVYTTNYAHFNGTSMATPHVSAVAARVWSYHPSCTAEQIRQSLNKSALDIDAPGRDDRTDDGLVQAKAAVERIASVGCGL